MSAEQRKLRVGVLFGGRSGEHEVSLASAASIIRGLDSNKYEAVPIGITKEGHWLAGAGAQKMLPEVLKTGQRVAMSADPSDTALISLDGDARGQKLDVIFPVIHGTFGEDGTMQGLLELAGLPFVGAGVLGSAIGMDKDVAKKLLQVAGIPVVPWIAVQRADWERNPKEIRRAVEKKFKYPVFVKPATLGSSVGMTKVHSRAELGPALDLAAEFAMKIMVERAVKARRHKPMFMLDLAVPRDIESEVGRLDDVFLYTVDDLASVVQTGMESRLAAVSQAEAIIDMAVHDGTSN